MKVDQLLGRGAIITGASQGLGVAIATEFVHQGANVLICARDPLLLQKTLDQLKAIAKPRQKIMAQVADVGVKADCELLVNIARQHFEHFCILVNNAAIHGPHGLLEEINLDDWETAIQINLMGSLYMMHGVLDHFKSQQYGKIIQLSGGGATKPMPHLTAYAASKAAVVRLAESVAMGVMVIILISTCLPLVH